MSETMEAGGTVTTRRRTTLTPKEKEVLRQLMQGLPNRLIGLALSISEATVKVHVKSILRVMGVDNRTQAAIHGARYLEEDA